MVSARRWKKYINYLAVIFSIFLISCSDSGDKFNLVLKSFSNNNDTATISFKNLDTNETITESIKTKVPLDINIDLDSHYSIEYYNSESDIFGYINKIKPSDYTGKDVFLTLNKNNGFRQLVHVINDTLENGKYSYYMYANNSIYRALGSTFKKLSLVTLDDENINKPFAVTNDKVISLNGEYLINDTEISFVDKKNNLKFIAHNIMDLTFSKTKYVKMNDDYFLVYENDNSAYNCVRLNKQINDEVKVNIVNNCIDENISFDYKLLTKNNEFYLWDTKKLYKYSNSKFSLLHEFENSGIIFRNNNDFYLISSGFIYLINVDDKILTKLNLNPLSINNIVVFDINSTTTLITSKYWNAGDKYYVFSNNNSEVTMNSYEFPDYINLKNIVNIKLDNNQSLFFNNLSFESSGQVFNNVTFYLFSNFK